jgi:hypothetical protein
VALQSISATNGVSRLPASSMDVRALKEQSHAYEAGVDVPTLHGRSMGKMPLGAKRCTKYSRTGRTIDPYAAVIDGGAAARAGAPVSSATRVLCRPCRCWSTGWKGRLVALCTAKRNGPATGDNELLGERGRYTVT